MPWNSAIEQEYDAMLSGNIGQALGYSSIVRPIVFSVIKGYLRNLETSSGGSLNLSPGNHTYLTATERIHLHLMRVACCLYTERIDIWPWQLRNKSVAQLRPLLHIEHQGLRPYTLPGGNVVYTFHGVWDVRPEDRMTIAVFGYLLMAIFGDVARTESEFVQNFIQNMRDAGWRHFSGYYDVYVDGGYTSHSPSGIGTYDFDDVAAVKQGGCHTTSAFLVSSLRPFNIPAHVGYGIGEALHRSGHCFVHFPSLRTWLAHGDDVYNAILKGIPPAFAMRSEWWMNAYHKGATDYQHLRARAYDDYFWWCLLIGESSSFNYDVASLYAAGQLRDKLENIHIDYNLASRDGAPAVVPPVFTPAEVDSLMGWVDAKLS